MAPPPLLPPLLLLPLSGRPVLKMAAPPAWRLRGRAEEGEGGEAERGADGAVPATRLSNVAARRAMPHDPEAAAAEEGAAGALPQEKGGGAPAAAALQRPEVVAAAPRAPPSLQHGRWPVSEPPPLPALLMLLLLTLLLRVCRS